MMTEQAPNEQVYRWVCTVTVAGIPANVELRLDLDHPGLRAMLLRARSNRGRRATALCGALTTKVLTP